MASQSPRRRLRLETLEERSVPATLVALTADRRLLTFDSAAPNVIQHAVRITGVPPRDALLAIDSRPSTGLLYGLTSKGVFELDPRTGVGTSVATFATPISANLATGFDFNPLLDRARITNTAGKNLRLTTDLTGLTQDTDLSYEENGPKPLLVGSAYTNPDNNTTTDTRLYGIDLTRNALVVQDPANGGRVTSLGALGTRSTVAAGFDIGPGNEAFLTTSPRASRSSVLHTVDLATGATNEVGQIGGRETVTGLAVMLPAQPVYAITSTNQLVTFNAAAPEIITSTKAIGGLATGETVKAMDFRPSTGELFASTTSNRVVVINVTTGAATQVNQTTFGEGNHGFDFNPVADALRVVTESDQNLRFPDGGRGTVVADTNLAFVAGDANAAANPNVVASAYQNNFPGATTTTLFGIDANVNILVTQVANDGTLTTVGALGINPTGNVSFDITAGGTAFAVMQLDGQTESRLFTLNLTTGTATAVVGTGALTDGVAANNGVIGSLVGGRPLIVAMSAAPPTVKFQRAGGMVREGGPAARVVVIRTGDTTSAATVNYATAAGTATAGSDYTETSGTLTFAAGAVVSSFEVPIVNDTQREPTETIAASVTKTAGDSFTVDPALDEMILSLFDNDGRRIPARRRR